MMKTEKRKDYLDWDETFVQLCNIIAQRSKDPSTQNGSCIVNDKNIILGMGYNGFPYGCSDDVLSWSREGDFCDVKYAYVVHAEANAIFNANGNISGARIYCNLFPCNECAKIVIQNGIKEIIYTSDKYHDDDIWKASRKLLDLAGVKYRKYEPKNDLILNKRKK
jgi:dCMP deaminase